MYISPLQEFHTSSVKESFTLLSSFEEIKMNPESMPSWEVTKFVVYGLKDALQVLVDVYPLHLEDEDLKNFKALKRSLKYHTTQDEYDEWWLDFKRKNKTKIKLMKNK